MITSDTGICEKKYKYDVENRLIDTTETTESGELLTEYEYDNNGNMIAEYKQNSISGEVEKDRELTYDEYNRLIEVKDNGKIIEKNKYNYVGQRIQKVAGNEETNYIYDGTNAIIETDEAGEVKARNYFDTNIVSRESEDERGYYVYNGQGDVTEVISKEGDTIAAYEYDAFGNILKEEGEFDNPYRYSGYVYDEEIEYYYLKARMYNPEVGRFIQEDTYKGESKDPLSLNLYTYCKNNPLIYNDPTGHWPQFIKKSAQKVISVTKKVHNIKMSISRGFLKGVYEFAKEVIVGVGGLIKGTYKLVTEPVKTLKSLKKTAVNVWNTGKYIYKNPSVIAYAGIQMAQEFINKSLENKVKMITKTGISIIPVCKLLSASKLANVTSKVTKLISKANDFSKGSSKLAKAIKYANEAKKNVYKTFKKVENQLTSIKEILFGKKKSSNGATISENTVTNNVNSNGEKVLDLPGNLNEANCFVKGTKVSSENGLKPIEKIEIGDKVWSKNEETGEVALKKVKNIFVNKTKVLVHVIINGEEIKATEKHPFYVEGKGWVVASELNCGDIVIREDGSKAKVESVAIEKLEKEIEVYNFEVEDFHTYFVGENRILVHNTCGGKPVDEVVGGVSNRVYQPSPKHDPTSGWGSPDPIPDIKTGQELLDTAYSSSKNKQLYNLYKGKLVKFQPDTVTGWHSYLVENPAKEVPADVLRQMLKDGKITKAQYKNFIKNN